MKKLIHTQRSTAKHWVGDGFPVRTIFSYSDIAESMSPFLLMDYAEPVQFPPSEHIRGVGEHPHRGFETVTIVYSGEVDHRDSSGGGGRIGPGDVQWMTAASGLVHEEMHGHDFAKRGGAFEMVQLWVNLPAKDKMTPPHYQSIQDAQIPVVALAGNAGTVRVIAGKFGSTSGAAKTFTGMNVWDVRLKTDVPAKFEVPEGHTAAVFVLSGKVRTDEGLILNATELGVLDPNGTSFALTATEDAKILFLGGEPIREPIVGYGPFVMNSEAEIRTAIVDFRQGRMGRIGSA